ncbi:MAG: putative rane protein [Herbinix sp.]|nr:putative rane protein [Herbinix sp.]
MKTQKNLAITKLGWLLFYLYIVLLSYFLFFSEAYGRSSIHEEYRFNLEFFKEINRFITYRNQVGFQSFAVNIIGNVLAFAPFGFLLPLLNQRYRKFIAILSLSILFSLAVEAIQLYLKVGIFDVDDILLNTLGGVLGYICFRIYWSILKVVTPKKSNRRK